MSDVVFKKIAREAITPKRLGNNQYALHVIHLLKEEIVHGEKIYYFGTGFVAVQHQIHQLYVTNNKPDQEFILFNSINVIYPEDQSEIIVVMKKNEDFEGKKISVFSKPVINLALHKKTEKLYVAFAKVIDSLEDPLISFIRINENVDNLNRLINILMPARYSKSSRFEANIFFKFQMLDHFFTDNDIETIRKFRHIWKYDGTLKNITLNFLEKASNVENRFLSTIPGDSKIDEDFYDSNQDYVFEMVYYILRIEGPGYFFKKPLTLVFG